MELTTLELEDSEREALFMMSKIQNLNGTHNRSGEIESPNLVVYDVKDTKFEWNSQRAGSRWNGIESCL